MLLEESPSACALFFYVLFYDWRWVNQYQSDLNFTRNNNNKHINMVLLLTPLPGEFVGSSEYTTKHENIRLGSDSSRVHSKNKTPVLGNDIPVLGMKLKRE